MKRTASNLIVLLKLFNHFALLADDAKAFFSVRLQEQ